MTPTTTTSKPLVKTQTMFDLDTMSNVTLVKRSSFTDVSTTAEALQRLNGSTEKLVEAINRGLKAYEAELLAANTSIPWTVENEEGEFEDFTGTPADDKKVNALVLSLAKSMGGYHKGMSPEEKKSTKAQAIEVIRNTAVIREGLIKNSGIGQSAAANGE
jgi:hypothetical protein